MVYVFDSSFIGALIIPDEQNRHMAALYSTIQNEDEKFVPHFFWYEIGYIFKNLVRRKRYIYDEVLSFIPKLQAMRLTSDTELGAAYTEKLLRITMDYDITAYNAAYLELAGRKKAVLCTLDENLQRAADKYGVVVLK